MTPEEIAVLKRLHEAATQPPWSCSDHDPEYDCAVSFGKDLQPNQDGTVTADWVGQIELEDLPEDEITANVELVPLLRNSLPIILADLELVPALQEQNRLLGDTLEVQRAEYEERLRATSERLAKLEEAANGALIALTGTEINPANFDHDDVVALNDAANRAYNRLATALAAGEEGK